MRKKILLILTLIISFVLYTNNVEAAGECANDTDKLIDGYCCPEGYTSKVSTNSYTFSVDRFAGDIILLIWDSAENLRKSNSVSDL